MTTDGQDIDGSPPLAGVLSLGWEGAGFDPDRQIATWVGVARLEAELEVELGTVLKGDPEAAAAGVPGEAGSAFVLCDADLTDEPAPRVSVAGLPRTR